MVKDRGLHEHTAESSLGPLGVKLVSKLTNVDRVAGGLYDRNTQSEDNGGGKLSYVTGASRL